nr:MAG: capsid protein [Chemarfal virus 132]
MYPWTLWAGNSYVKNKLNNYSWFRGDLKVKFQMTASPFYYGKMLASYQPLPNFSPSTIVNDAATRYFSPVSQRPHIVLEPGKSDSYEMTLPFIYPANWLNIQLITATQDMGLLSYHIYSTLQSANGVSSSGITVAVYAWVENIELSGASVGYAMQSDEFGEGCVSKPASWVAKTAAYFENVPVIGAFATATKIGANAVSAIASLFGFTNVPVIDDTSPYRPEAFPKFASSEIGFPVERLTLDPKNELSIDPRVVGLNSGTDEMALSYVAGRESWLTKINWDTSDNSDAILFYSRVNPLLYDNDNQTNAKIYLTPMGFITNAFDCWRGDIIYRFHIVASKYHKGKLIINFDPTGYSAQNIGNTTPVSNVVHTAIVDIGETQNVEFRVPYQMATQFLNIRPSVDAAEMGWAVKTVMPATYPASQLYDNGMLTVRVLNALSAPVLSSNVDIHVYVRAAENIEFANPTDLDSTHRLSFYAPQSEQYTQNTLPDQMHLSRTGNVVDNQYLVHFGENIKSLRSLLHRYTYVGADPLYASSTAAQYNVSYKNFLKMPLSPGYTSLGSYSATKIVGVGNYTYNFVNMTPLAFFSMAYLCYRGSVNWSFDVTSGVAFQHLRVVKDNISQADANIGNSATSGTNASRLAYSSNRGSYGSAGLAVTNQLTQSGINVQVPHMSIYKFQSTNTQYANSGSTLDGSKYDAFRLEADWPYTAATAANAGYPAIVHTYVGSGTDFSLHFFLNVPTLYKYASIPQPI